MDTNKQDIIRKVKNLLKKTEENGSTEAEAASAITLAHKIMAQYKLSMSDVEVPEQEAVEKSLMTFGTKSLSDYQWSLANKLASYYACSVFKVKRGDRSEKLMVVGETLNVQTFTETMSFAYNVFLKYSSNYLSTIEGSRSEKNQRKWDYFKGFVIGICACLQESIASNALTLYQSDVVKDEISKMNVKTEIKKYRENLYTSSMSIGYFDGKDAMYNKHKRVANGI